MSRRVYVGNLSYITTEETLRSVFSKYGELLSVTLIVDRDTQQSKGFGFIEFAEDSAADAAIAAQSGKELDGRRIRVSVAEEKRERTPRPAPRRMDGPRRGRGPRRSERDFGGGDY